MDDSVSLEFGEPDEFCALCGADDKTDGKFAGGRLLVPVVTEAGAAAVKAVCDACLAMVLNVVLQRASRAGIGTSIADAAIEDQDGENTGE